VTGIGALEFLADLKELYVARKLKSVEEKVRSAIVNCLCPECGGALNSVQTSSDAWAMWKTVAKLFGKAQSATLPNAVRR